MIYVLRLLGLLVVFGITYPHPLKGQAATTVPADMGGIFYASGPDTLRVTNHTWMARDSAPALADCVYSGTSQRMLARDSMRLTVGAGTQALWTGMLRTGDRLAVNVTWNLPSGHRFTLLDISAPESPCGVNAGQAWFHWRLEQAS